MLAILSSAFFSGNFTTSFPKYQSFICLTRSDPESKTKTQWAGLQWFLRISCDLNGNDVFSPVELLPDGFSLSIFLMPLGQLEGILASVYWLLQWSRLQPRVFVLFSSGCLFSCGFYEGIWCKEQLLLVSFCFVSLPEEQVPSGDVSIQGVEVFLALCVGVEHDEAVAVG